VCGERVGDIDGSVENTGDTVGAAECGTCIGTPVGGSSS
jgi:hypothetical protein